MLSSRTNAGITTNLKMLNEVNAVSFLAQLGQRQTCSNVLGRFALFAERVFNKHGRGHGPEFHPISCFILVTSFFVLCFFLLCCLKCPHSVLSGSLDFLFCYHQLLKVMLSTCNVVLSLTVTTAFA